VPKPGVAQAFKSAHKPSGGTQVLRRPAHKSREQRPGPTAWIGTVASQAGAAMPSPTDLHPRASRSEAPPRTGRRSTSWAAASAERPAKKPEPPERDDRPRRVVPSEARAINRRSPSLVNAFERAVRDIPSVRAVRVGHRVTPRRRLRAVHAGHGGISHRHRL